MNNNLIKVIVLCFFSTAAFSQFHFGAGAQLQFDGSIFGIQGKAFYEYDDAWRGSGTFTFHLDDVANYSIDLDAQYKLLDISDNFNLAPLAGLSILNFDFIGTELGLNLGAFLDFDLDGKHVYAEPKILFVNGGNTLVVSAGLFF